MGDWGYCEGAMRGWGYYGRLSAAGWRPKRREVITWQWAIALWWRTTALKYILHGRNIDDCGWGQEFAVHVERMAHKVQRKSNSYLLSFRYNR